MLLLLALACSGTTAAMQISGSAGLRLPDRCSRDPDAVSNLPADTRLADTSTAAHARSTTIPNAVRHSSAAGLLRRRCCFHRGLSVVHQRAFSAAERADAASICHIVGTPRRIAVWDLEVKNVGTVAYDLLPAWQMYVSTVTTGHGDEAGIWGASRDAAAEAGIALVYEAITLPPGATRTFSLAAYIPDGTPKRFTYMLDPTTRESGSRQPGSNPLIWINATNPGCSGDIRDPDAGGVLPTPIA